MTQGEFKDNESIPSKKYYVLTEDVPCWHWSRNEDDTLDWNIMGYNSKEVSPREVIPEEDFKNVSDDYAIEFLDWYGGLRLNQVDGKKTNELLEIFKKEKGL